MSRRETPRSVVFVNRFYWPDIAATGQLLGDLCEDLAARGWSVTVVTGRGAYENTGAPLPRREVRRGVTIIRVSGTRFGRVRMLGRMLDYASYAVGAAAHLVFGVQSAVIVGLTDPPMIMAVAVAAAKLRGAKAVYWTQDVYPELAVALGVLGEDGVIYRMIRRFAKAIAVRCDMLVALGPEMAQALARGGAPPERVRVVHNWADTEAVTPVARPANPFVLEHGLGDSFVVLYSGNAGRAHTFVALKGAMLALRDDPRIRFLFIGGGTNMDGIREFATHNNLRNVRFLDYVPRDQLAYSLSAADVSVVTEESRVVGLLVPSKTYGILASGRPILFIGSERSDVAAVVRDARCGRVVGQDDTPGVVAAITDLLNDAATRIELGRHARVAAETTYGRHHATAKWAELLERCIADPTLA